MQGCREVEGTITMKNTNSRCTVHHQLNRIQHRNELLEVSFGQFSPANSLGFLSYTMVLSHIWKINNSVMNFFASFCTTPVYRHFNYANSSSPPSIQGPMGHCSGYINYILFLTNNSTSLCWIQIWLGCSLNRGLMLSLMLVLLLQLIPLILLRSLVNTDWGVIARFQDNTCLQSRLF